MNGLAFANGLYLGGRAAPVAVEPARGYRDTLDNREAARRPRAPARPPRGRRPPRGASPTVPKFLANVRRVLSS